MGILPLMNYTFNRETDVLDRTEITVTVTQHPLFRKIFETITFPYPMSFGAVHILDGLPDTKVFPICQLLIVLHPERLPITYSGEIGSITVLFSTVE